MGMSPISYQEIKAYSELMGISFTPNEVLTLKRMSVAYISQSYDKSIVAKRPYKSDAKVGTKSNFVEALKKIAVKK